jgi:hypothetical protein
MSAAVISTVALSGGWTQCLEVSCMSLEWCDKSCVWTSIRSVKIYTFFPPYCEYWPTEIVFVTRPSIVCQVDTALCYWNSNWRQPSELALRWTLTRYGMFFYADSASLNDGCWKRHCNGGHRYNVQLGELNVRHWQRRTAVQVRCSLECRNIQLMLTNITDPKYWISSTKGNLVLSKVGPQHTR